VNENPESDPAIAKDNAQANFDRLVAGIPKEIQQREERVAEHLARLPGSSLKRLRALHKEMEIFSAALAPYVACKAGCTSCCHYEVHLYPIEAELIEKRTTHRRLPTQEAPARFHGTPCPFLHEGHCGIYDARPMSCRQHVALTQSAYWCDPARSDTVRLPMAQLSRVQEALLQIVHADGRTDPVDIRQVFGAGPRTPQR
jgi:Fe-S-cluster containining protein